MPVSGVITEYEAVLLQLVIERPCWSNGHRQCYCWHSLLKKHVGVLKGHSFWSAQLSPP
jgi:hypothetical protein